MELATVAARPDDASAKPPFNFQFNGAATARGYLTIV
jgi:hypothetical protein